MENLNRTILAGNLVRDMELTYSSSGYAIGKISIAVNSRKKQGDQYVDEVSYFEAVLFGKRAESLQQYLVKGQTIELEGRLKQDRWEHDGQKRSKVVINIDNIYLVGGRKDSNNVTKSQPNQQNNNQYQQKEEPFTDSIPF